MIRIYKNYLSVFSKITTNKFQVKSFSKFIPKPNDSVELDDIRANIARKLIFSERKYIDFTEEEKQIVDLYQEKICEMSCGCVTLPNTKADLERTEFKELMARQDIFKKV